MREEDEVGGGWKFGLTAPDELGYAEGGFEKTGPLVEGGGLGGRFISESSELRGGSELTVEVELETW